MCVNHAPGLGVRAWIDNDTSTRAGYRGLPSCWGLLQSLGRSVRDLRQNFKLRLRHMVGQR